MYIVHVANYNFNSTKHSCSKPKKTYDEKPYIVPFAQHVTLHEHTFI